MSFSSTVFTSLIQGTRRGCRLRTLASNQYLPWRSSRSSLSGWSYSRGIDSESNYELAFHPPRQGLFQNFPLHPGFCRYMAEHAKLMMPIVSASLLVRPTCSGQPQTILPAGRWGRQSGRSRTYSSPTCAAIPRRGRNPQSGLSHPLWVKHSFAYHRQPVNIGRHRSIRDVSRQFESGRRCGVFWSS